MAYKAPKLGSIKDRAQKAEGKLTAAKAAKEKSKKREKMIDVTSASIRKLYNDAPSKGRVENFDRYTKQQAKLGKMSRAEKVKQGKLNQTISDRSRTTTRAKAIAKRVAKKGK